MERVKNRREKGWITIKMGAENHGKRGRSTKEGAEHQRGG